MQVTEASALEDTLARLRQRYALYCYLPSGTKLDDKQAIRVELSPEVQALHAAAEVQSRRIYMAGDKGGRETSGPATVTRARSRSLDTPESTPTPDSLGTSVEDPARKGPRRAVNEDSGEKVNTVTPPEN